MRKAVRAIVVKDDALLTMHRNKFGEEYYTLVGGGIDVGETPEATLRREVMEETSLQISNPRLVFIEQAGDPYGDQYIYLCDYAAGEVALPSTSDEAKINELGQNLYTPMWLPVKDLQNAPFFTNKLKSALVHALSHGFPEKPEML